MSVFKDGVEIEEASPELIQKISGSKPFTYNEDQVVQPTNPPKEEEKKEDTSQSTEEKRDGGETATEQKTETDKTATTPEQKTEEAQATETDTNKEKTETTEQAQEQKTDFSLDAFKEKFGVEAETEEDIQEILSYREKYKELEEKYNTEVQEWKSKYEEIEQSYDPGKLYANETLMKMDALVRKYPDLNMGLASRVNSFDAESTNPLDAAILGERLQTGDTKTSDKVIRQAIANRLGVEEDDLGNLNEDEHGAALWNLNKMAAETTNKVKEMQNVELPQRFDYEKAKQEKQERAEKRTSELTGKWSPVLDKSLETFSKDGYKVFEKTADGESKVVHTVPVSQEFKDEVKDKVMDYVVNSGMDVTRENIQKAYNDIARRYRDKYEATIVKDYGESIKAKMKEEFHKELHNPGKENTNEAPSKDSTPKKQFIGDSVHDPNFMDG